MEGPLYWKATSLGLEYKLSLPKHCIILQLKENYKTILIKLREGRVEKWHKEDHFCSYPDPGEFLNSPGSKLPMMQYPMIDYQ